MKRLLSIGAFCAVALAGMSASAMTIGIRTMAYARAAVRQAALEPVRDVVTVTFDANGGVGGWSSNMVYGTAVSAPTVTREGYTFAGWSPDVAATVPAGDVTYTAQWTVLVPKPEPEPEPEPGPEPEPEPVVTQIVWTVTFDANGGGGTMSAQTCTNGVPGALPANAFVRTGHTFAGWATNETGEALFADCAVVSNLTDAAGAIVDLYAVWTPNSYAVTFDANGGVGGWSSNMVYGTAIAAPTVTRTGHTFKGWSPSVAATVPASNVTYVAQWEINRYAVTFDANGGVGGWSSNMVYGIAVSAPTVTREGYTFAGWSPDVAATVPAGDVTYTASWTRTGGIVGFASSGVSADEGGTVVVRIGGGSVERASSVKVYLTYQTASSADLDLAKGAVDGSVPKGGLRFPLELTWRKGEMREKAVSIPVKADRSVEADETFTLQLADAIGAEQAGRDVCTATLKDPGYAALGSKVASGSATRQEISAWNRLQRDGAFYIRGLASPADGGKVSGGGLCAPGKKTTLRAAANRNFRFVGWSDGARTVATTASLVLDRTSRPAASTRTSTTLTSVAGDATYFAVFEGDPRATAIVEDSSGANPAAGKVAGTGRYAAGKKATLRASAGKGYIFGCWLDQDGAVLSRSASYSFAMPAEDVSLTARFITAAEDLAAVSLDVGGRAMSSSAARKWTLRCGVAVDWPVSASGLSETTVKAAGLPAGLKLVQDRATKAYSLSGAPTAASKVDPKTGAATPSKVKFTVTTAGRSRRDFSADVTVLPLPSWAAGTFDGAVSSSAGGVAGLVQPLSVAANGRISGKVLRGGLSWTLSASSFDSFDEAGGVCRATVVAKSGRQAATNAVEISAEELVRDGSAQLRGVASCRATSASPGWTAWQNLWNAEPWKTVAKPFAKAPALAAPGGVSLRFASTGAVTAKLGTYSCSSTLIPAPDGTFTCFLYFPPKGSFGGYAAEVPLAWDGAEFTLAE